MSSLRKKVSSYFRQLSFHNEPREKRLFINENTFVNKYLTGQISLKDGPPVLHGKTPNDLPNFEIGGYATGAQSIVGCATGPNGGLTTVKRIEKHLSIPDADDIDYIDKQDDVAVAYQNSAKPGVPEKWDKKTDFVYGLSDSLYDTNQVSREKNGNPIADCFGVIAREDSAILGLADGVNWGEKASIAAKSAVHGSLHYINKTVFDDTSLFNFEIDSLNENAPINTMFENCARNTAAAPTPAQNQITNTNEIFICLLRAFNSAHNLILENGGMLTTLTVAVVLPLKQGNYKKGRAEKYICCVCNLGDTFAYVYSPKCGIREITKGSHDITSNRDMRDALGALGPVDGINPELNNLTLSATTLEPGDIVLVASDGLTDNYDPSVCKFTVNQTVYDAPKHKATNINPQNSHKLASRPPVSKPNTNRASLTQAQNPPHGSSNKLGASNISRLASTNINSTTTKPNSKNVRTTAKDTKSAQDEVDFSNPLVAQFIQDNAISAPGDSGPPHINSPSTHNPPYRRTVSMVDPNKENKKSHPLSKSSSTSRVLKTKTNANLNAPAPARMAFLRSKTSIDLNAAKAPPQIKRNEEGLPFVAPLQKYELTLLLMEDILLRGLSGREAPCVTARILCENLLRYTVSITAAKRRSLEDKDLYYDLKNDVQVEVSAREKKLRRKKCLEKVQNLPGKLDHVTVVAYNVGNRAYSACAATSDL